MHLYVQKLTCRSLLATAATAATAAAAAAAYWIDTLRHFYDSITCSIKDFFRIFWLKNHLEIFMSFFKMFDKRIFSSSFDCSNFPTVPWFKSNIADLKVSSMILSDEFWNSSNFIDRKYSFSPTNLQFYQWYNVPILHWLSVAVFRFLLLRAW